MRKIVLFYAVVVLFSACTGGSRFRVKGVVADAAGETLYFEKNGLLGDSLMDSVKLTQTGHFQFKSRLPEYPELYRLRLKKQSVILGISDEQEIEIAGNANQWMDAAINGSQQSSAIQQLRKSVVALQTLVDKLSAEKNAAQAARLFDTFQQDLAKHKQLAQQIILSNTGSIASYYALYQQINGQFIFSPRAKEDRKYFQAVATAFHNTMPEYGRSKNLYNQVIAAIQEDRAASRLTDWEKLSRTSELGFIDIELKDNHGYPRKLSALVGKPILLDFSAYATESSVDHTFTLREIHDRYAATGLQIYQVSLDQDRLFWERAVSTIPWVCVFDNTGITAKQYNISEIPSLFLIDRSGNIIGKYQDAKSAEAALAKMR